MTGFVRSRRIAVAGASRRDPADRRRTAPHGRAGTLIQLQRTAGNRATARLVDHAVPRLARPPVVQRAPKGEYGLDTPVSEDKYAAEAVKLWQGQKAMSLTTFADTLLTHVVAELATYKVPAFTWKFDAIGVAGIFDSEKWVVTVDVSKFSHDGAATTVGDLSPAEVTDVVGTLYHEARHADQDVLIIRRLLDARQKVPDIITSTKIKADIVRAVAGTTYADPLDAEEIAHAERMFDVMYGAHKQLLQFLIGNTTAFDGLGTLKLAGSDLAAADPHVTVFFNWQSAILAPKVDAMTKAAKSLTPTEKGLLADLRKVNTAIVALAAGWAAVPDKTKPRAKAASVVRRQAGAVEGAVATAYKHLEGEKDAFRVEGEVKAAFAKANQPSRSRSSRRSSRRARVAARPAPGQHGRDRRRELADGLVLRELLGGARHVHRYPLRKRLLARAVGTRWRVLLVDGGQALGGESIGHAHHSRPQTSVDEGHLALDQPRADHVRGVGEAVHRIEDGVARRMAPPATADRFTSDQLGDARERSARGLEEHALLDQRHHRVHGAILSCRRRSSVVSWRSGGADSCHPGDAGRAAGA